MSLRVVNPTSYLFDIGRSVENPWRTAPSRKSLGKTGLVALELCAGAGGQALGLEQAGIEHAALVEIDALACATLNRNRPHWRVLEADLNTFDARAFIGADIVSAG